MKGFDDDGLDVPVTLDDVIARKNRISQEIRDIQKYCDPESPDVFPALTDCLEELALLDQFIRAHQELDACNEMLGEDDDGPDYGNFGSSSDMDVEDDGGSDFVSYILVFGNDCVFRPT